MIGGGVDVHQGPGEARVLLFGDWGWHDGEGRVGQRREKGPGWEGGRRDGPWEEGPVGWLAGGEAQRMGRREGRKPGGM